MLEEWKEFPNGIEVGVIGSKGGFCLGWRQHEDVIFKRYSQFHIDVEIRGGGGKVC